MPDRKDSHLSLTLHQKEIELYSENANGFSAYRFEHMALPELDFDKISLKTEILGKKLSAPLIIGAMTGGTAKAAKLNLRLARLAERCQIGFALGSQRKLVDDHASSQVWKSFDVKEVAPRIPLLFGNIGAVQLNYGVQAQDIRRFLKKTRCDAMNFHLNPLQEAIQPEGNRNFSGLIEKLEKCIPELGVPVFLKEVGAGISSLAAQKLKVLPIQGIECAGVGGTSWAKIESMRSQNSYHQGAGELFSRWGIPTAESIVACRSAFPHLVVIGSGGIRNGIEIAKSIALGADAVAMALPILKEVEKSIESAHALIEQIKLELRIAMFVTGCLTIQSLRHRGSTLLTQISHPGTL